MKSNHNQGSTSSLKNLSKSNDELNKKGIFNINIIPINNLNYAKSKKSLKLNKAKTRVLNQKKSSKNYINIYKMKNYKKVKVNNKNNKLIKKKWGKESILDIEYRNYQSLNIQEMNTLDYKEALLIDKRSYTQYYCSLIRKKQIIIFTFVPIDDYNLVSLKISLFLLSFSLYMTVNAFFFTDNTMHQIYKNTKDEVLLYHIPQILYSSLICSVVNTILKQLSLSEDNILSIRKVRQMKQSYRRANEVRGYLTIKFIAFFIVSFILVIFYWYFISCFCAVYTNTQLILIKDSLISFGASLLYPFGINLLPGVFRIPALRAKNQDQKCIYKFSQLLSLI